MYVQGWTIIILIGTLCVIWTNVMLTGERILLTAWGRRIFVVLRPLILWGYGPIRCTLRGMTNFICTSFLKCALDTCKTLSEIRASLFQFTRRSKKRVSQGFNSKGSQRSCLMKLRSGQRMRSIMLVLARVEMWKVMCITQRGSL